MLPFFPSHGNRLANVTATTMPSGKNCFDANNLAFCMMIDNDGVDDDDDVVKRLLSSTPPPWTAW